MENENTQQNNWLEEEIETTEKETQRTDHPALKLEEGKICIFEVDFSEEFEKWIDKESGYVKKLIPVMHEGQKKIFWLNTRNPLYLEILKSYKEKGQTLFKVLRTGMQQNTKYNLVKD